MKPKRLDAAWVLGMLADLVDEILEGETLPAMDEYTRREVARRVLSRVHDVQQLDPDALPDCPTCSNSGGYDEIVQGSNGELSRVTRRCDCGHPLAGGDR
jgi:hypothetical protein